MTKDGSADDSDKHINRCASVDINIVCGVSTSDGSRRKVSLNMTAGVGRCAGMMTYGNRLKSVTPMKASMSGISCVCIEVRSFETIMPEQERSSSTIN